VWVSRIRIIVRYVKSSSTIDAGEGRKTRRERRRKVMEPEKAPQQLEEGRRCRRIVEVREMRWHPD